MNFNTSNLHQTYIELLLEKTLNNRALAKTLFEKIFATLPVQIDELAHLLNRNDISQAQQLIHDIHGTVASCGLVNLEYHAGLVERHLFENDLEKSYKSFQVLQQLVGNFLDCQDDIVSNL